MKKNNKTITAILSALFGFLIAKYVGETYLGLIILGVVFLGIYLIQKVRYKEYEK